MYWWGEFDQILCVFGDDAHLHDIHHCSFRGLHEQQPRQSAAPKIAMIDPLYICIFSHMIPTIFPIKLLLKITIYNALLPGLPPINRRYPHHRSIH